jgi:hypothetical protein
MDDVFAAGDRFLLSEARLLERRLFSTCFLGAPASGVIDAPPGYQNPDGGFGQALEPGTRCPPVSRSTSKPPFKRWQRSPPLTDQWFSGPATS